MKKIILFFIYLSLVSFYTSAQEVEKIKIKKEDPFFKAEFDEANYKVIALDKYGNPYENAVKSFVITFQDTEGHFQSKVEGNTFPEKTIKYLKKRTRVTNLCLQEVKAVDEEGHEQILPVKCGILIYPDCKDCDPNKKKQKTNKGWK